MAEADTSLMTQPDWHPTVADKDKRPITIEIPARPAGLWTKVADYIPSKRKLKIQVVDPSPLWTYDPDKASCPPDGAPAAAITGQLVPWVLAGCLIGKVGGSASDITSPPAAVAAGGPTIAGPQLFVFAVGGFCIVQVPDTVSGALFLTMNDAPANFAKHAGSLHVQVFDAV